MPDGSASHVVDGMTVVPGIDALEQGLGRLFVVVGVFDGLHRGHLYLLRHLGREAASRGARPAVVTFDHHPDEVLTGAAPPLLCDPRERLERLAAAGVAVTVVQHFDLALRMTPYGAFVRRIAERVPLAGFLMTPDAAFGHERRGTAEAVAALGRELGYEVALVPPLDVAGRHIRSADIRAAIASGDLAGAARLLGRAVSVSGLAQQTVGGTAIRSELPVALPPDGAYPARVSRSGRRGEIARELIVRAGGVVVRPPIGVPDGLRLRARLPVRGAAATIRRS